MELSINFLVGLILGVVLLSLGLVFTYKMVAGVGKIEKMGLPSYFEIEEQNCVQRNERVCIPTVKQQVETLKTASYGVIINNIYGEEKTFRINVEFRRGILEDGSETDDVEVTEWTFEEFEETVLENNDHIVIEVPIRPPAKTDAGAYVFNVNVCFDADDNPSDKCDEGSLYAPTQQITVEVI